jgi:hypothetical protein
MTKPDFCFFRDISMTLPNFGSAARALILSAAVAGLSLPTLAYAGEKQAQATAEEDDDIIVEGEQQPKKVCKMEAKTGSNLVRRVCRTVGDKDAQGMDRLEEMRQARDAQQRTQQMGSPL